MIYQECIIDENDTVFCNKTSVYLGGAAFIPVRCSQLSVTQLAQLGVRSCVFKIKKYVASTSLPIQYQQNPITHQPSLQGSLLILF
jgi:hypothetical protein